MKTSDLPLTEGKTLSRKRHYDNKKPIAPPPPGVKQMTSVLNERDEALLRALKVDSDDFERGISGFSKCENITISVERYRHMMRLIFKLRGQLQ